MNRPDENQHWISQCLLKRFKLPGAPFQCLQVSTGDWIAKSLGAVCSAPGYNQLIFEGITDNTLEAAFSAIESALPNTLRSIVSASKRKLTELPQSVYQNLCWYLSFLKGTSPYAKPGAVVTFLFQLNWELENGHDSLLKDLDIPDETIRELRHQCSMERRVIIESENLLQLVYRYQFRRNYLYDYSTFLSTRWTISRTPMELPISDAGIVAMRLENEAANHYLLPLGPDLLLEGILFHDPSKNSTHPTLESIRLTTSEALYRFDCICASAITELICSRKVLGIPEARERAKQNGTKFARIVDPKGFSSSGLMDVGSGGLRFRVVSVDEYVKAVHAHMKPSN